MDDSEQNKLFNISILLCPWNNELAWTINPYNVTCLFLYLLKISENLRFSDVFRRYKKNSGMKWVNKEKRELFDKQLLAGTIILAL